MKNILFCCGINEKNLRLNMVVSYKLENIIYTKIFLCTS